MLKKEVIVFKKSLYLLPRSTYCKIHHKFQDIFKKESETHHIPKLKDSL